MKDISKLKNLLYKYNMKSSFFDIEPYEEAKEISVYRKIDLYFLYLKEVFIESDIVNSISKKVIRKIRLLIYLKNFYRVSIIMTLYLMMAFSKNYIFILVITLMTFKKINQKKINSILNLDMKKSHLNSYFEKIIKKEKFNRIDNILLSRYSHEEIGDICSKLKIDKNIEEFLITMKNDNLEITFKETIKSGEKLYSI